MPVFLLGHSVGGVVSCIYALDNQSELAGLLCESFAFRVYAPDFALAAIIGDKCDCPAPAGAQAKK
ncbi:MAG: alpha/beta hydrolase [Caldilineaceae bacterium]|nr:alpha/beta hydrolase [Caldilineaceae bacterium]